MNLTIIKESNGGKLRENITDADLDDYLPDTPGSILFLIAKFVLSSTMEGEWYYTDNAGKDVYLRLEKQ